MNKKPVKLTSHDYYTIKDAALRKWLDKAIVDERCHHVIQIVEAFIEFTNNNNYIVINGQIFNKDEKET